MIKLTGIDFLYAAVLISLVAVIKEFLIPYFYIRFNYGAHAIKYYFMTSSRKFKVNDIEIERDSYVKLYVPSKGEWYEGYVVGTTGYYLFIRNVMNDIQGQPIKNINPGDIILVK